METKKVALKDRLEKALRRPVPQVVFDKYDREGVVEDYFEGSLEHEGGETQNFQALKGIFAEELDYLKAYRHELAQSITESPADERESTPPLDAEPSYDSFVGMRARVISEVWAALADERPDVTEFRQTVLDGRTLSPELADTIMDAPGNELGDLRELELRKLGNILANDYFGWDEEGAIWYVLTRKAPRLRPVRIVARGKLPVEQYLPFQYEVTLSVLPWVPVKEVERAYRSAQEQLLQETSRETGLRILEVVQFWWEQFRTIGPMPSWRAWFEMWNQAHPDKKFREWRNFREYFFRGTKAAQPHYRRYPQPKLPTEEYEIRAVQGYRKMGGAYTEATFE